MPATILITRPQAAGKRLADLLRARLGSDVPIVLSPLMKIESVDAKPPLDRIKTLIFTSVHAVHAFATVSPRRDFRCYAVGTATAKAARHVGFEPLEGPGTGEGLAAQIMADEPPMPCLYVRGDYVAFDMENALVSAGIETMSAVFYRQVPLPLTSEAQACLNGPDTVIAPLFSPRSARLLCDQLPQGRDIWSAVISASAASAVPSGCADVVHVSDRPDLEAMLDEIETLWNKANQLEGNGPAQ